MSSEPDCQPLSRHSGRLTGRRVILAVTGGIAAYKSCILVRDLIREGAEVQVLMSRAGTEFVSPLTFSTLSGRPVIWEMFPAVPPTDPIHLSPAHWGEAMLIAPATADFIGKLTHGLADDIPSATALAFHGPLLIAPAMNPNMWKSSAVQANAELLRKRGIQIIGPEYGEMGGVNESIGTGRMSEPEDILDRLESLLSDANRLSGRRVLVTSGPTREKLDPVRFLSNFSSGRMGDAVAREAFLRGAEVILVRGKGATGKPPSGVEVRVVDSALEMSAVVKLIFPQVDLLVMAAAVADWTPARLSPTKIKKDSGNFVVEWKQTEDILAWAGKNKSHQIVVGFALETSDHLAGGKNKLATKDSDIIVLNDPTRSDSSFGGDTTNLTLLRKDRAPEELGLVTKRIAAGKLLDAVEKLFSHV